MRSPAAAFAPGPGSDHHRCPVTPRGSPRHHHSYCKRHHRAAGASMSFDEENIPTGKPPRALNEVLGKLLRRMHVSDESSAIGLFSGWRQIVGDQIADHAVPKRLEKRILVVEVDDPAWATQLKFLESQLIATLRDNVGDEVESLEIRVRRSR
ncbi:MAG: DUF721 domain-containing protein [Actinobacteria bacterium]|nr:DUF721 domain-containing protein [Actinomycetota bacterium]